MEPLLCTAVFVLPAEGMSMNEVGCYQGQFKRIEASKCSPRNTRQMEEALNNFLSVSSSRVRCCGVLKVGHVCLFWIENLLYHGDLFFQQSSSLCLPALRDPNVCPRHEARSLPNQIIFGIGDCQWLVTLGLLLLCVRVDDPHVPVRGDGKVHIVEFKLLSKGGVAHDINIIMKESTLQFRRCAFLDDCIGEDDAFVYKTLRLVLHLGVAVLATVIRQHQLPLDFGGFGPRIVFGSNIDPLHPPQFKQWRLWALPFVG